MDLSSTPGVQNHDLGNRLDLVWSNASALADISIELDSTSDYRTLAGHFPHPNSKASAVIKPGQSSRVTDDALEDLAKMPGSWAHGIGLQPMVSISAVDNLTDELVQTISDAIRTAGGPGSAKKGRTAPWWTLECLQSKC